MSRLRLGRVVLLLVTALFAALLAPAVSAVASEDVVLADFEAADALKGATLPAPELDRATLTRAFATEGRTGMLMSAGAFQNKAGSVFPRVWLNVGSTLPDVDWTQRTYLHVSAANGSVERARIYVVVWDANEKYLLRSAFADPFGYLVFQIKVSDIAAAGVDLGKLTKIQISTERSPNPKQVYVDDIRLTDQAADVPAEQAKATPKLIAAMGLPGGIADANEALDDVRARIKPTQDAPDVALRGQATAIEERLDGYAAELGGLDNLTEARTIWSAIANERWRIKRLATLVDARVARPNAPVGLGFADSMSKVYPRDLPCDCSFAPPVLDVVRGEYESTQLVALPYGTALTNASVSARIAGRPADDLTVEAHPVYAINMVPPVEQKPANPTAYRPSIYEGWTPDPIQTARDSVTTASGDLQAFWVTVHTEQSTRPGLYPVEITLKADGIAPQQVGMRVRVWDVAIAPEPKLRTAIGHDPLAYAGPYGITDPNEAAELVAQEYAFLGKYGLQGDNIYRSIYEQTPPSVESLRKIDEEGGGLRQFNIWYFDPRLLDPAKPDTWAAKADELFDKIQPYVDQYRAAGFIDKAYLYCCDETGAAHTEVIRFVLTRFKERFPDIEVLTTAIDNSMGAGNGLGQLIDWWVRDVPWYDPQVIADRHAAGREAWWYLHVGNANPIPNVFVNYDPGQLRTMLGPMSFQSGVDGWLYYRVDRWYGKGLVDAGPLSPWEPRTFGNYSGDGSLLYPGPDGPIPSIRLENLRDGLEDYNLLAALRTAIDNAPPGTDLARAKHLLVATDVVHDSYEYARDPAIYRTWRNDLLAATAALL